MTDGSINSQMSLVLRILIVDDQAFFRRGIREVLNDEADMQVVAEALDGSDAVRIARDLRPDGLDLVLMDMDMPHLDGIAAAAQLRAEDPDLPVVMLTASTLDADLFEAVRVGAVGFLNKSLAPDALVRVPARVPSWRESADGASDGPGALCDLPTGWVYDASTSQRGARLQAHPA